MPGADPGEGHGNDPVRPILGPVVESRGPKAVRPPGVERKNHPIRAKLVGQQPRQAQIALTLAAKHQGVARASQPRTAPAGPIQAPIDPKR